MRRLLLAGPVLAVALAGCASSGGDQAEAPKVSCSYRADGNAQAAGTPSTTALLKPKTLTFHLAVGANQSKTDLPITTTTTAPCTVNAMAYLASKGYFDATSCHRLTTAGIYVLQCGDPTATGSGTPGFSYADELSGSETYGAGTIAMANAGPNTNGSQFFVVYADSQLPPKYTVWGHIDAAGIAAVAAVAKAGTDNANGSGDGHPKSPVNIVSVSAS